MKFSLDKHLDVDLQYIFGSKWNVNAEDLQNYEAVISNAAKRVQRIRETGKGPGGKAVLFSRLPYILDENVLMAAEERLRLERLDGSRERTGCSDFYRDRRILSGKSGDF